MGKIRELYGVLTACPFLKFLPGGSYGVDGGLGFIYVDGLGTELTAYDFAVVPGETWQKKYVDGGGVKRLDFLFRSRKFYSRDDAANNIRNHEFFERFADWLTKTANIGIFSEITPLTGGYCFDVDEGTGSDLSAVYQIQCRALYAVG